MMATQSKDADFGALLPVGVSRLSRPAVRFKAYPDKNLIELCSSSGPRCGKTAYLPSLLPFKDLRLPDARRTCWQLLSTQCVHANFCWGLVRAHAQQPSELSRCVLVPARSPGLQCETFGQSLWTCRHVFSNFQMFCWPLEFDSGRFGRGW